MSRFNPPGGAGGAATCIAMSKAAGSLNSASLGSVHATTDCHLQMISMRRRKQCSNVKTLRAAQSNRTAGADILAEAGIDQEVRLTRTPVKAIS
jgi:hypothetical protein